MTEYVSVSINRHFAGNDGETAYECLSGKLSEMIGTEFAETVMFRRVPTPCRFWEEGTFIGQKTASGEYMVTNAEEVYKTRTVRRVPAERRWMKASIENVKHAVEG